MTTNANKYLWSLLVPYSPVVNDLHLTMKIGMLIVSKLSTAAVYGGVHVWTFICKESLPRANNVSLNTRQAALLSMIVSFHNQLSCLH